MERAKLKQNILISAFIAVVLVSGYLVYSNFLQKPKSIPVSEIDPSLNPEGLVSPDKVISSKLKTDLLSDPRFSSLKIFGNVPIEVGTLGRDNPFIPYDGYKQIEGGSQ